MIGRAKLGSLTQGTVFCCARAEDYLGCHVHGLVITARCDVANDKAPVFSYLPLVPLRDWFDRDGGNILANRVSNDALGIAKREMKNAGHSIAVLDTEPLAKVVETLFPEVTGNKAATSARERMLKATARFDVATACLAAPIGSHRAKQVIDGNSSFVRALLGELTAHRLTGYYFLSRVDADGPESGYVALLREVRSLPRSTAAVLAGGVDLSDGSNPVVQQAAIHLAAGDQPYAMPVGQLGSPMIEHVMQQFALTFSRIGVADVPAEYVQSVLLEGILGSAGDA